MKHGIPVGMSCFFFSKIMYYRTDDIPQQLPFTLPL